MRQKFLNRLAAVGNRVRLRDSVTVSVLQPLLKFKRGFPSHPASARESARQSLMVFGEVNANGTGPLS